MTEKSAASEDQANLGLATTRELLDELRARAECTMPSPFAWFAQAQSRVLLDTLPEHVLDYRTVDG